MKVAQIPRPGAGFEIVEREIPKPGPGPCTAVFDATGSALLEQFFRDPPGTIDHVMVTAARPHYGRLLDMDFAEARSALDEHLLLALQVARNAAQKVRPEGTLLFMGGTGARRPGIGLGLPSTATAALPALTANRARARARPSQPIAAGSVDTPLSASILGDELENCRNQLRAVASHRARSRTGRRRRARHTHQTNTALAGAAYDIDGGQQLVGP
jgi:hypothetical protein